MKKQLLTGALTIGMLLGSTGMALAADSNAVTSAPTATITAGKALAATAVTTITADGMEDMDGLNFHLSDYKTYTVEEYAAQIETVQADLNTMVANQELSQEQADLTLKAMRQNLQDMKDGKLTIQYLELLDENNQPVGSVSVTALKAVDADPTQEHAIRFAVEGQELNSQGQIQLATEVVSVK